MHLETKLQQAEARYEELTHQLADPSIFEQPGRYAELTREFDQLKNLVSDIREWKQTREVVLQNEEIIDAGEDAELAELARQENRDLRPRIERLESSIELKLIPKDPEDSRNCIMEIRAGTGGDEAAIFAGDLYEMYRRYADLSGWTHHVLSLSPSEKGGVKEIVFEVKGPDAYGQLKYESGVHRVQRVPETESQGRIHTSAATVAVLPEAEEVDIHLDPKDLRIDTFRSSGAGGQHVNKTAKQALRDRVGIPESQKGAGSPQPGLLRRQVSQDPHIQLPPGPAHGPPHRPDPLPPRGADARRDR
jgi:peptide chain release factor 1